MLLELQEQQFRNKNKINIISDEMFKVEKVIFESHPIFYVMVALFFFSNNEQNWC